MGDNDLVETVCSNCGTRGESELGFLKSATEFRCHGCGELLRPNPYELVQAMNWADQSRRPKVTLDPQH
jgi:tRNA(Ile2) C34 agmatinyltransferase TiaS